MKRITMKALAITHKGLEDVTSLEIQEFVNSKTEIKESCVIFEAKGYEELALVCYKAQSVYKVLLLLDNFKVKSLEDLCEYSEKSKNEIKKILEGKKSFVIKALHKENDFSSDELCSEVAIALDLNLKVDYKNPDVIIFIYAYKNDCYLGIDFSGVDLSKRDYRIYVHQEALKATIAYSLLRIADYKDGDYLVDPFCGSGTILIEAGLFSSNLSQNYFSKDKFKLDINLEKFDKKNSFKGDVVGFDKESRHIRAAEKNSKIAGVDKYITFSKLDVNSLDKKLKEKSVDKIVTNPPNLNKRNERFIEKIYNDFFNQAKTVLKDSGTITLITKSFDLIKKAAKGFKIEKEIDILIGNEDHKIIVFKKEH